MRNALLEFKAIQADWRRRIEFLKQEQRVAEAWELQQALMGISHWGEIHGITKPTNEHQTKTTA